MNVSFCRMTCCFCYLKLSVLAECVVSTVSIQKSRHMHMDWNRGSYASSSEMIVDIGPRCNSACDDKIGLSYSNWQWCQHVKLHSETDRQCYASYCS